MVFDCSLKPVLNWANVREPSWEYSANTVEQSGRTLSGRTFVREHSWEYSANIVGS